jgi:hypothetical protein
MDYEKKNIVQKNIVLYILLLHLKAKAKLDLNSRFQDFVHLLTLPHDWIRCSAFFM